MLSRVSPKNKASGIPCKKQPACLCPCPPSVCVAFGGGLYYHGGFCKPEKGGNSRRESRSIITLAQPSPARTANGADGGRLAKKPPPRTHTDTIVVGEEWPDPVEEAAARERAQDAEFDNLAKAFEGRHAAIDGIMDKVRRCGSSALHVALFRPPVASSRWSCVPPHNGSVCAHISSHYPC